MEQARLGNVFLILLLNQIKNGTVEYLRREVFYGKERVK